MAGRIFAVPRGTFTPDGLCGLTDAQYASDVDTSPSISAAYARLGRVANPAARMCAVASVFGRGNAPRNISGAPKGDAPAGGEVTKGWHKVGTLKATRSKAGCSPVRIFR